MASTAVARETVFALRREIARIEGILPERLAASGEETVLLRWHGRLLARDGLLATGVPALDAALGGGVPKAALTEIHGRQVRDAGAVAGFVLALAGLLLKQALIGPILWIGTSSFFAEVGLPYAHGLLKLFGIAPKDLLLAEAPKPVEALWIAEEAAALKELAVVVLELPGNPRQLDLTATRRLHRRAVEAGRPVFLLRHSAGVEATAAPLRFVVEPAPAGTRRILGRPLVGSIGPPAFAVTLDKNRLAPPARFTLEWNADERTFGHRSPENKNERQDARHDPGRHGRPQDPVALVSMPQHRPDLAAAAGSRLAYGAFRFPAAADQPA
jgi:protein ImuA